MGDHAACDHVRRRVVRPEPMGEEIAPCGRTVRFVPSNTSGLHRTLGAGTGLAMWFTRERLFAPKATCNRSRRPKRERPGGD